MSVSVSVCMCVCLKRTMTWVWMVHRRDVLPWKESERKVSWYLALVLHSLGLFLWPKSRQNSSNWVCLKMVYTPHMVLLMGKMMINHDQPMDLEASYLQTNITEDIPGGLRWLQYQSGAGYSPQWSSGWTSAVTWLEVLSGTRIDASSWVFGSEIIPSVFCVFPDVWHLPS